MLYEFAYPLLYVCAKSKQFSKRTQAYIRLAPPELRRVTYKPETCYRLVCWQLRKLDMELLMRIAPRRAAHVAIKRFEKTKRDPRAPLTLAHPERFTTKTLMHNRKKVRVLCYGQEGNPRILALHGWNGKAAMLHKMNLALAAAGFYVCAPDLPGHGASEGDRYSFHSLGKAVVEIFGKDGPYAAIIGHSGGGLIASIALAEGFQADRFIPIGAPASLHSLLRSYVEVSQMPSNIMEHIVCHYDRHYRVPMRALGSETLSAMDVQTLVIHDSTDWMVGEENAHELARCAKHGALMLTTGYTHLSIVNAPDVHQRMLAFIGGGPVHA